MFRYLFALALTIAPALAQNPPIQGGPWAPGHAPMYVGSGSAQAVLQDSGPASGGATGVGFSEIGLTARAAGTPPYANAGTGPYGTNFCDYDAPTNSAAYHYFCLSPNAQGGGLIAYGAAGTAAQAPLKFIVNGSAYQFPFTGTGTVVTPNPTVIGDLATWNNTLGTALADKTPTSFFDTAYCSTVGYLIVRFTGAWTCSQGVPANVMWFGALCDGSTNDLTAIQNALNVARSVLIPPTGLGCSINGTLTYALGYQTLRGEGPSNSFLISTASSSPMVVIPASFVGATVRDLGFTRASGGGPGGDGVIYSGFQDSPVVYNVQFKNQYVSLILGSTGYGIVQRMLSYNSTSDCVDFQNPAIANEYQWNLDTTFCQSSGGRGYTVFAPATAALGPQTTMGTWTNVGSNASVGVGVAILGNSNVGICGLRMVGGFLGTDGGEELLLDSYCGLHQITGLFTEFSGANNCIDISAHNTDVILTGVRAHACKTSGLFTAATTVTSIVGGAFDTNGTYGIVNAGVVNITGAAYFANGSGNFTNSGTAIAANNFPTSANFPLGVACSGAPTAAYQVSNGVVTHC